MSNNKEAAPGATREAASNINMKNIPQTALLGQIVSRLDFFAAATLQGMITRCPDGKGVFRLCVENASSTANTAYFIAREMENYARRNDEPPRRKRKGGVR